MTKNNKYQNAFSSLALLTLLLIGSFMLISCTSVEEVVEEVVVVEEPTAIPIPDQSEYHVALANSTMTQYDIGHGPNDWCAACHSPQNWNPEATVGASPNCVSCKFDGRDLTVGDGNDLILEEDWIGVPCATCHEIDENGTASAEIAWLNPITMEYIPAGNSTELCERCHATTVGGSFGSRVSHKVTLGGSAHLLDSRYMGDVAPPQYCADCHDPHDNQVVDACEDCHAVRELETHMLGFNAEHENVSCQACHESTGMDVGPSLVEENGGLWVTQETTSGRGGPSTNDVNSHSIAYAVLCDKCHIADSPFGLTEYTATGAIPKVDICVAGETLNVEKPTLADYGEVDVDFFMGKCVLVDICKDGETLNVWDKTLIETETEESEYGEVDVDYTLEACPTEEAAP